jgi:hypothetical protein
MQRILECIVLWHIIPQPHIINALSCVGVLAATPGDVGLATHEEMTPVNCGDIPNKNGHI